MLLLVVTRAGVPPGISRLGARAIPNPPSNRLLTESLASKSGVCRQQTASAPFGAPAYLRGDPFLPLNRNDNNSSVVRPPTGGWLHRNPGLRQACKSAVGRQEFSLSDP
jgi:hypothetical protein